MMFVDNELSRKATYSTRSIKMARFTSHLEKSNKHGGQHDYVLSIGRQPGKETSNEQTLLLGKFVTHWNLGAENGLENKWFIQVTNFPFFSRLSV